MSERGQRRRLPVVAIISPRRVEVKAVPWSMAGTMVRLGGRPGGWRRWSFRVGGLAEAADLVLTLDALGAGIAGGGMVNPSDAIDGMRERGMLDDRPFLLATYPKADGTWHVEPF